MEKTLTLKELYRNKYGILLTNLRFRVFTVTKLDGSPIEDKEEAQKFVEQIKAEVDSHTNFEKAMSATIFMNDSATVFVKEWNDDFDFVIAALEKLLQK